MRMFLKLRCGRHFISVGSSLLMLLLVVGLVSNSAAQEVGLTVRLRDGRTIRGALGAQTDTSRLWIAVAQEGILLSSAHNWIDIESLTAAGDPLTKIDVLERIAELKAATTPEATLQERIAFWFPVEHEPYEESGEGREPFGAKEQQLETPLTQRRVESLEIEAHPANWDRDAQLDGVLAYVRPLDSAGRIVPVEGQIRFELFGERYAQPTRRTFDSEIAFPNLGTWTQRVRRDDFGPDGVTIRLPFRRLHPQVDTDLAAHALLTARLGIAGIGTFDASAADVLIRPASRYRDDVFQRSRPHSRFHHNEW